MTNARGQTVRLSGKDWAGLIVTIAGAGIGVWGSINADIAVLKSNDQAKARVIERLETKLDALQVQIGRMLNSQARVEAERE